MNKELIKKYRKEFDHWLDGGEVLVKHNNQAWYLKLNNHWEWDSSEGNCSYIIDDEYVEFRKALAEGKSIITKFGTWSDSGLDHWMDFKEGEKIWGFEWKIKSEIKNLVEVKPGEYRIKPDEAFRVGDYVVYSNQPEWEVLIWDGSLKDESIIRDCKLWTLEEADDDEWVYSICNHVTCSDVKDEYKSRTIIKASIAKQLPYDTFYPYIGQSPKQLGLEK